MDWQKYTFKAENAAIQEALQVCADKLRKKGYRKPIIHRKSYCKYDHMEGKYPGDKVQIDIKYVPDEWIRFPESVLSSTFFNLLTFLL